MTDRLILFAIMGFLVSALGGVGYAYMDFAVHRGRMFTDFKRSNPIGAYKRLVRDGLAPAWPLYLAICIPVGMFILFGSITISNQHH